MVSFAQLAQLEASGTAGVIITVVDSRGSSPRKAGARMAWLENGQTLGTVGGGAVEHAAIGAAPQVLASATPRIVEVALGPELGMCCGGTMRLYLEPMVRKPPFILLGGGHVAQACAPLLTNLGFVVHVADEREGFATAERFGPECAFSDGMDAAGLDALPFGPRAHVLICTHDHALDQRMVEATLRRPTQWLGMMGSRRKALKTRERCLHRGFSLAELEHLVSPVGLDLGAQTPHEIAVSVAAEMVALRNHGQIPASGVRRMALALHLPQATDAVHADDAAAAGAPLTHKTG